MTVFQGAILRWFQRNQRDLPWRKTRNSYRILVSEIMLQQTQVDRVREKYRQWLRRFPTIEKLARAKPRTVITAWKGMGYNRRALNLHRLAKAVIRDYEGRIPQDIDELEKLPGIGPYTARAVASFAYDRDDAVLDTNVRRIIHRVFFGSDRRRAILESRLYKQAESIIPKAKGRTWNGALMDFGSAVCTSRQPLCNQCPVRSICKAYPAIMTQKPVKQSVAEQTAPRTNIPNRIIRGRIVEDLRSQPSYQGNARTIAERVHPDYRTSDWEWFNRIIRGLERDGLIQIRRYGQTVAVRLP